MLPATPVHPSFPLAPLSFSLSYRILYFCALFSFATTCSLRQTILPLPLFLDTAKTAPAILGETVLCSIFYRLRRVEIKFSRDLFKPRSFNTFAGTPDIYSITRSLFSRNNGYRQRDGRRGGRKNSMYSYRRLERSLRRRSDGGGGSREDAEDRDARDLLLQVYTVPLLRRAERLSPGRSC